jgi:tRNA (guanine-N7-)-methyltransferase
MTEVKEEQPHLRKIRSFVLREGRVTNAQERALKEFWPLWGLDYQEEKISIKEIFKNDNPTTVEIGFGMGKSLIEMAKADPNRNFIGIEVHKPGVGAILAGINDANINNIRVIRHDAVEVLQNMLEDNSIDRLQLYFPDPWHKARHHKRRIVKQEFLDIILPKLTVGGVIHMATDWEDYANQMLEVLTADTRLSNLSKDNTFVPRPDYRPMTKFEQRGIKLGHGVWDLLFTKH